MPRVLDEPIAPSVLRHFDEADDINKKPRICAGREGDVEEVDAFGNLVEKRRQRLPQQFKAEDFRVAQLRNRGRALGLIKPRPPHCAAQMRSLAMALARQSVSATRAPHARKILQGRSPQDRGGGILSSARIHQSAATNARPRRKVLSETLRRLNPDEIFRTRAAHCRERQDVRPGCQAKTCAERNPSTASHSSSKWLMIRSGLK